MLPNEILQVICTVLSNADILCCLSFVFRGMHSSEKNQPQLLKNSADITAYFVTFPLWKFCLFVLFLLLVLR